jgi:hypothetical protein
MANKLVTVLMLRNQIITRTALDTDDLVSMLELTVEDILDKFPNKLYQHREKFIPEGCALDPETGLSDLYDDELPDYESDHDWQNEEAAET